MLENNCIWDDDDIVYADDDDLYILYTYAYF